MRAAIRLPLTNGGSWLVESDEWCSSTDWGVRATRRRGQEPQHVTISQAFSGTRNSLGPAARSAYGRARGGALTFSALSSSYLIRKMDLGVGCAVVGALVGSFVDGVGAAFGSCNVGDGRADPAEIDSFAIREASMPKKALLLRASLACASDASREPP